MIGRLLLWCLCWGLSVEPVWGQRLFRVISYNVENLFDTRDNPDTDDQDFLPDAPRHWTPGRYYHKLQQIAKVITAAGEWDEPALIGLCEVENDSTLHHLCHLTPLRRQAYRYVLSQTNDPRGIRVALLYQRAQFALIGQESLFIPFKDRKKRSRPLLHVWGRVVTGDTLDLFVCHFPSRAGGYNSDSYRLEAASHLRRACDSLFQSRQDPHLLLMGDFKAGPTDRSLVKGLRAQPFTGLLGEQRADTLALYNLFATKRRGQPEGSHKYHGDWSQLDHFLVDGSLLRPSSAIRLHPEGIRIYAADFLFTEDKTYYGRRPKRSYYGFKYEGGFSDHLPLVVDFYLHLPAEKENTAE